MNIFSYIYPVPSYKNRSWIGHSGKVSQLYCYKIIVIFRYIQMLFSCLLPVLLGEESQAIFSQNCRSYHFIGRRFTDKVYKCFTMLSEFFLTTFDFQLLSSGTFGCWTNSKSWNKMYHAYILAGKTKLIEVGPSIKSFTTASKIFHLSFLWSSTISKSDRQSCS